MRTALAVAICMATSGLLALSASAGAPRKHRHDARPADAYSYRQQSAQEVCEERARAEDPTGAYVGFPCWAREAFSRGSQGNRGPQ